MIFLIYASPQITVHLKAIINSTVQYVYLQHCFLEMKMTYSGCDSVIWASSLSFPTNYYRTIYIILYHLT